MADDKQKQAEELKKARRGKYSDRIKYDPYVQMRPKPEPFVPQDKVKKT